MKRMARSTGLYSHWGNSELMLSAGGKPSAAHRREFDLYIHIDQVDHLYSRLKDRVQLVEVPHDTFYGMREFIIRDLNGFWITFRTTHRKVTAWFHHQVNPASSRAISLLLAYPFTKFSVDFVRVSVSPCLRGRFCFYLRLQSLLARSTISDERFPNSHRIRQRHVPHCR